MTKEELENKKLELEIKKLGIPWYKNIEFWKVTIPTIAVLLSLFFTFGQGLIDSEKAKLEIQKEQLRLDITKFEIKSDALTVSIQAKDSIRIALERQIFNYTIQRKNLAKKINELNDKVKNSGVEIGKINSERSKDKKFYQDKLLKEYSEEKSRLQELGNLKSQLNQKDVTIAVQNAEIEFLKPKVKLTQMEGYDLEIKKHTASSNELSKQINSYQESSKRLKEKYELEKKRINSMSADEVLREFELNMLKFQIDEKGE